MYARVLAYNMFVEKAQISHDIFSPVLTRDCLGGVNKPDPRVALHILGQWDKAAEEVWFVGDSIDDVRCGKWAGCRTCMVTSSTKIHDDEHLIDFRVKTLSEFVDVLSSVGVEEEREDD